MIGLGSVRRAVISTVAIVAMVAAGCDLIPARRRIDPEYYPVRQRHRAAADRPPLPEPPHRPQRSLARRHSQPQLPKLQRVEPEDVLGPPPPTPMLDASLRRAEAVRQAALDGFDQAPDPNAGPVPKFGQIEYVIDPSRLRNESSAEEPADQRHSKPDDSGPRRPAEATEPEHRPPAGDTTTTATASGDAAQAEADDRASEATDTEPSSAEPSSEPEAPQADTERDRFESDRAASDRWRHGLAELLNLSSEAASEGGETAEVWAARRRVLDWLTEAEPQVDDATLWRTVMTMLAEEGDPRISDMRPPADLDLIRPVADVKVDPERRRLELNDLRLCREVSGYGVFDELDPEAIAPGQDLIVYCELAGVRYEPLEDGSRSLLLTDLEITTTEDDATVWSESRRTEDRSRTPRHDYYVGYLIALPESMPEGRYRIRVSQRDRLSGGDATGSLDFQVVEDGGVAP